MLRNLENFSLPEIEEKVLKFWRENQVFENSLRKSARKRKFVFYEGPPTANGRPGIHHVLARAFKDVVLRYKTMAGFYVPRRAGWDTHGLPVEIEIEKELGLKSKRDIERYGIGAFNQKCKESVWRYKDEWEKLTERIGFWLDFKNPYITYESSYIESLWSIIKEIWRRRLLYRGYKVVPWCTRCGTALSSHEMAQGYDEVLDNSVYVKFKLKNPKSLGVAGKVCLLGWTTTPWTLPGNVALAVGPDIKYQIVATEKSEEKYIIAENLVQKTVGVNYEVIKTVGGKDLTGLEYEPLFNIPALKSKKAFKVYPADFVSTEEGTGIVHTAVMYGEDDYNLGLKVGLPQHHTVDERGMFSKDVPGLGGLYVKDKKTEDKIISYLKDRGFLLKTELYKHDYPFCWRCRTPLLYYARHSWFIAISKLRQKLIAANETINWIPAHIKRGRFGEWLESLKDWAFSRERYWGTPLPVWVCNDCGREEAIGSLKEFSQKAGSAKNRYFLMRHGEALSNIKNIVNSNPKKRDLYPLTLRGRVEVQKTAAKLKKEKIDLIFSSNFLRAKETAEILAKDLGIKKIIFDKRIREINTGIFDSRPSREYHAYFSSYADKFSKRPAGGENLQDLAARLYDFLNYLEKNYSGKKILIVSHEYPIWMMETIMSGRDELGAIKEKERRGDDFISTGEAREVPYLIVPRDDFGFGDLHRPYVDKIILKCSHCGGKMKRVEEVIDVWFDSGAMPFAQSHWPFEKKIDFPADYIAEGVDQTRGWFYTLLAVAALLGRRAPYKNVISLGHVLDKNGQKMSKSKGNVVDPWQMIQKYGADVVRWYFYTINPPGEPKKFDEADLSKTSRQFISLLHNSFVFLNTYDIYVRRHKNSKFQIPNSKLSETNVLDRWILARLHETILIVTNSLNKYEVGGAAKALENFVGDLSRWYIRRSRRRFQKPASEKDYRAATSVLTHVLKEISKLLSPFTPFFAEALYQSIKHWGEKKSSTDSVHWASWPKTKKSLIDKKLLSEMAEIRRLASLVLAKRAAAGIKVRQPLALLRIRPAKPGIQKNSQLINLLKEETNVKNIVFDPELQEEIWLDTTLTHELKEEGWLREFIRIVQDLRQDARFSPQEKLILLVEAPEELVFILRKNEKLVKNEVNVKAVEYGRSEKFTAELATKLDQWPIWVGLRKPL